MIILILNVLTSTYWGSSLDCVCVCGGGGGVPISKGANEALLRPANQVKSKYLGLDINGYILTLFIWLYIDPI